MASTPPQLPPAMQQRPVKPKTEVPDEVAEIVSKSLQVGASAGACGLVFGATAGIIRGTTPVLFSLVSGIQWFGLGSVYYGTRRMAMARHGPEQQLTPYQKVEASTLGGAISGATIAGLTRGPRNILPAGLVFSVLGAGGQLIANRAAASSEASQGKKGGGWLDSKWSPMTRLTDREYENILEERLLSIEAEIAIIDENVAELRAQRDDQIRGTTNPPPSSTSKE